MQHIPAVKSTGAIAFQKGVIFAGIFVVLQVITLLLNNFLAIGAFGAIVNILSLLLSIVLFLVEGSQSARLTGRASTGAMAGTFTGIMGGVVSLIADLLITALNVDTLRQSAQEAANELQVHFHYTVSTVFAGSIIIAVLGLLFAIGLGAAVGALGGLMGRKRAASLGLDAPVPPSSWH